MGRERRGQGEVEDQLADERRHESSNFVSDGQHARRLSFAITSQLTAPITSPVTGSTAIFGCWDQLILMFWGSGGADILVNPYETTAYAKGNIQLRAFLDCDVLIRQPKAFAYVSAISV